MNRAMLLLCIVACFTSYSPIFAQERSQEKPARPRAEKQQTLPPAIIVEKEKDILAEATGYVGGALGFVWANKGIGPGLGYGAELGFFPKTYLGLAALYRGAEHGAEMLNIYGAQFLLRPTPPLTLGLLLGGARVSNSADNTGDSFAYGGRLSYDILIGETAISYGPQVDLIQFKPNVENVYVWQALLALKLWL